MRYVEYGAIAIVDLRLTSHQIEQLTAFGETWRQCVEEFVLESCCSLSASLCESAMSGRIACLVKSARFTYICICRDQLFSIFPF